MKTTIDFGWEADEDRLWRWVKISPKKKLDWLYESHQMMQKVWTKEQKERFLKLRQAS